MNDPQLLLEKERLLRQELEIQEGLPHLHGWKFYKWARAFYESNNKMNLLCAANQISKSSTQIRKCIDWATNPKKWKKLWGRAPLQFWYLYPNKLTATVEFEKKWIPEFMPRGKFKDDPQYGWKEEYKNKEIFAIHFNTGVTVYFKAYSQDAQDLQTGTCYAIFADEELPDNLYDELTFRLAATDGYFHMVFTATLGQQMWEDAIEGKGVNEKFPDAFKLQVSMYDCLTYEDGTKSHWTPERIQRIKNQCKSEQEIQRRVYGKFVKEEGLKYPSFDRNKNVKKRHPVPSNWKYYAGVDIGGGGSGHPAAIVFLAVSPDYRKGRIIKGWRGDGITTTAKDVFDKFVEMRGNIRFESQYYDWQAKDFFVIASRLGEPFTPADKSHESGESILNVLFKNEMLCIYDDEDEYELKKLVGELSRLNKNTPKNKAIDDFTDALRYTVTKVPWDFEGAITSDDMARKPAPNNRQIELQERKDYSTMLEDEFNFNVDEELSEWDEYLEG